MCVLTHPCTTSAWCLFTFDGDLDEGGIVVAIPAEEDPAIFVCGVLDDEFLIVELLVELSDVHHLEAHGTVRHGVLLCSMG